MNKEYDFLIVGAGFFGAICANVLANNGYKVLVIDKRDHVGGNCYTENRDGINVHIYGPHVFHTPDLETWNWINQYATFNNFVLQVVAVNDGEVYPLPFNMWTFTKLYGFQRPDTIKQVIEQDGYPKDFIPTNLEEQAIKTVGRKAYKQLIEGYTAKQWMRDPDTLPADIIKRLPVRFTYNNNYFNDAYQGIPIGGYTGIFDKLLNSPNIDVRLSSDFFIGREYWMMSADKVIFTGPIDAYYNYEFGALEYKTLDFQHIHMDMENFQGTAQMNFTNRYEVPYTRIIEHKFFENVTTPTTWITKEYPVEYDHTKSEPYYPVNDAVNNVIYQKYKAKADLDEKVIFGGRLAEYKYYDMHQVIKSALKLAETLK